MMHVVEAIGGRPLCIFTVERRSPTDRMTVRMSLLTF